MSPVRCRKNMAEAEEMFGARASECNSCPCDVGLAIRGKSEKLETTTAKEKIMERPLGTCSNCEREKMKLSSASGNGLCGSCQLVCCGLSGEARLAALAGARVKFYGKTKMNKGEKASASPKEKRLKDLNKKIDKIYEGEKKVAGEKPPTFPPTLKAKDEANSQGLLLFVPLYTDIAIRIPFTNRFMNFLRLSIGSDR